MRPRNLSLLLVIIGIAILSSASLFVARQKVSAFAIMENWSEDLRLALFTPVLPQDTRIVVLTITEETLAQLPVRSPLDRAFLSELLIVLWRAEVRAVGIDILLDQPTDPIVDAKLRQTMLSYDVPVVAAQATAKEALTEAQVEFLHSYLDGIQAGNVQLKPDKNDSIVRVIEPGFRTAHDTWQWNFAGALAVAVGKVPPLSAQRLAYRVAPGHDSPTFKSYPAHQARLLPPDWFTDKIVLIGADRPHEDRHLTPFAALDRTQGFQPGVMIHAHALSQFLDGRSIPDLPSWLESLLYVGLALIGGLVILLNVSMPLQIALNLIVAVVYGVAAVLVYRWGGPLLPVFGPILALGVTAGLTGAHANRGNRKQKAFIRNAFSKFVSPDVVRQLIANPDQLSLRGERRELTFVFTDIAGFTTLSESIDSETLDSVLNNYLDNMSRIVLRHGGMIDKFIGDAVVAIFGAPTPQPDHAARAVACALDMDAFAQAFAAEQNQTGVGLGHTRIGVHTGTATVGNFGGIERFDYTAIGDAVNTAARLESVNKHLGTRICISAQSAAHCPDLVARPIGTLVLKGKTEGIRCVEPMGIGATADCNIAAYRAAFAEMERRQAEARSSFEALAAAHPDDGLVAFQLKRLRRNETGVRIEMDEK